MAESACETSVHREGQGREALTGDDDEKHEYRNEDHLRSRRSEPEELGEVCKPPRRSPRIEDVVGKDPKRPRCHDEQECIAHGQGNGDRDESPMVCRCGADE